MLVGAVKNVCQTVLLFDDLSVPRSYVIIQFCVCFCPSVCLPVLVLSAYVSVRMSVHPPICIFL